MAVIIGRAWVHGIDGSVSFTGIGTLIAQSVERTHSFDVDEIKDASGDVLSAASSGERDEISMDFIPVAAAATNTKLNAKTSLQLPTPLSTVTFTGFAHADLNGSYHYLGGTIPLVNDGPARMTLRLRKYNPALGGPVS